MALFIYLLVAVVPLIVPLYLDALFEFVSSISSITIFLSVKIEPPL